MDFEMARFNMIEQQIRPWEVLDAGVLELLRQIPREAFVSEAQRGLAFADLNLPIGHDEAMWQPKIEARILQALAPKARDHVLEVGTGSGYLTALLASCSEHVTSVEIHSDFIGSRRNDYRLRTSAMYDWSKEMGPEAGHLPNHGTSSSLLARSPICLLPTAIFWRQEVG